MTCCDIIASLLGGWVLQKVDFYNRTPEGEEEFEYSERYNVLPLVSFFYTNEGMITYADGKKTHFRWKKEDEDLIKIQQEKDTTSIKTLRILHNKNNLILEEAINNLHIKRYFLAKTDYSIEALEDVPKFEITESDITSSMIRNPCPKIKAYIVKGLYVCSCKIQVEKSIMEKMQQSSPCSQKIIYLKSEEIQTTFPYYIITYDNNGSLQCVNYAGSVDW